MEQKRHDNDKKIVILYNGMKEMIGVLLLYVFLFIHGCHSRLAALRI
jgi:hypothetical protein